MSFPTYPEHHPIPPRSGLTIHYGGTAYLMSLVYVRGMDPEEAANHISTGLVEFIKYWNIPPRIALIVMMVVLVVILWDHLKLLGSAMP